jgi:hypothetical protein
MLLLRLIPVLGSVALLAAGWVEATFGPAQNKPGVLDNPIHAITSIELVSVGLACLALTSRAVHLRWAPVGAHRTAPRLYVVAAGLLTIGGLLWVPLWLGEYDWRMMFGPYVGLITALGMLWLLVGIILTGLGTGGSAGLPLWIRFAPAAIVVLLVAMWALGSLNGQWLAVAMLFAPFAAVWIRLGWAVVAAS